MSSTSIVREGIASPYIRLSPTAFLKGFATTPNLLAFDKPAKSPIMADSTPKSHRAPMSRLPGSNALRKKLTSSENVQETPTSKKSQKTPSKPRSVSMITKAPGSNAEEGHGKFANREKCQSAPISMYDNFTANVFVTPPRSLRRQQSASATMVSIGNGKYVPAIASHKSHSRFTPPIGEDVSTVFAGSKFSDSPSAKSLPLPPSQWLEEARAAVARKSPNSKVTERAVFSLKHVVEEDPSDEELSDDQAVFQMDGTPKLQSQHSNSSSGSLHDPVNIEKTHKGTRLDPLALIAAVAAS